ncbi:hypothetical protein [uncultured Methylibium sp.]|uniref:hypothetical protein n=1 Tax=uncultured Methylibium sp. TaxID=381093 RepID=UPI0025E66EA4|nr:hypothetical protein [uncultured Methylibium sp.]
MSQSSDRNVITRPPAGAPGWESTRVQTQVTPRLGGGPADDDVGDIDIGRAVGNNTRELFVACEPAEAMVQQFDHLQPEFVAVSDLGVAASRKLLAGIAAASQRVVQKLVVRRNGAGTVLATIEFVDCPTSNGKAVRLYSTEVDADTHTRQSMARVLLGRARLGVVMVGDLPAHALTSALQPWRDTALRGGWTCRRMLFMPLAAGVALPGEIARFRAATAIEATPTPQVGRPADVWAQLCQAWNTLQQQSKPGVSPSALPLLGSPNAAAAAAAPAAVAPGQRAMPSAAASPTPMPVVGNTPAPPRDAPLERYLHDLGQMTGVVSACAFDIMTGRPVGHAGARPGPDELARHGAAMLASMMGASRAMGMGAVVPETAVTLGQHHLLLRPLPAHPGMALHVVLDKPHVTLALVQLQLRRLDDALLAAARQPPATRF